MRDAPAVAAARSLGGGSRGPKKRRQGAAQIARERARACACARARAPAPPNSAPTRRVLEPLRRARNAGGKTPPDPNGQARHPETPTTRRTKTGRKGRPPMGTPESPTQPADVAPGRRLS